MKKKEREISPIFTTKRFNVYALGTGTFFNTVHSIIIKISTFSLLQRHSTYAKHMFKFC